RRQREVSAAPHRGNANRPLTIQGKAPKPEQGKAPNPDQGKGQSPKNTANAAAKAKTKSLP
ncbi:MAG: hypothetical protein ACN6OQ_21350, partial [Paraburkholderia nemoris]